LVSRVIACAQTGGRKGKGQTEIHDKMYGIIDLYLSLIKTPTTFVLLW